MTVLRAPGRVNLIGEHTDHTGGLVLPAAIDREIQLDFHAGGSEIRLSSSAYAGQVRIPADGSASARGWGRYVTAVASMLDGAGRPAVGLSGELRGNLPSGAGLSSSAALEVVVALALLEAASMTLPPMRIARLCQQAEQQATGVPVGVMDQAASLVGRAGHALLLDCASGEHRLVPLPDQLDLLVIDSGVRRQLEYSGYAARRRELEVALAVLGGRRPAEVDPTELAGLIDRAGLPEVPARRLRHVVTENARVRRVVELLTRDGAPDHDELARWFAASHASLRDDYEVSIPELDLLVELACHHGAIAARMIGGGFGGAILALVATGCADEIAAAVARDYARTGGRATAHVCRAVDGAGPASASAS